MTPASEDRVQLVLTLPSLGGEILHGRHTRLTMGVLVELFAGARNSVVLGAPFMQWGHGLSEGPLAVAANAALRRGIELDILGTESGLGSIDLSRLRVGARARIRIWVPAQVGGDGSRLGFHAKFCLADASAAYIGSANFTKPGLESQLEMGVLVHGAIAQQVREVWAVACSSGFVLLKLQVP
jgi:phosphatidylserine/phosphatidylglycerophosphate/cardiolipin synthase-like enzyme